MTYASQNNEAELAINYFGDRKITILDVGANDGKTFSNSYDLIKLGATAHLFEPATVCADLIKLHRGNDNVHIYNKGLGDRVHQVTFYESAEHVKGGKDRALVSTVNHAETIKWRKTGVQFTERRIQIIDFQGWWSHFGRPALEFITIDCESYDWIVLQQIDLGATLTEFIILEWNGDKGLEKKYTEYCGKFGLTECGRNSENIMYCLKKEEK